jgi:LysM repeat protein
MEELALVAEHDKVRRADADLRHVIDLQSAATVRRRLHARLRVGQTLRVNVPIVTRQTTSSRPSTARSTPNTPVASTKFYVVRKGDTLYSIANRYGISASALRNANNISGNNISVSV